VAFPALKSLLRFASAATQFQGSVCSFNLLTPAGSDTEPESGLNPELDLDQDCKPEPTDESQLTARLCVVERLWAARALLQAGVLRGSEDTLVKVRAWRGALEHLCVSFAFMFCCVDCPFTYSCVHGVFLAPS
jgi:hypothetical protein